MKPERILSQVLLGMDLVSETKMNSEGGDSRPGERKNLPLWFDAHWEPTDAWDHILFRSPAFLIAAARRRHPKKKAICPSHQSVAGPERGRLGGDARRPGHWRWWPRYSRRGGLPGLHGPWNGLGRWVRWISSFWTHVIPNCSRNRKMESL